MKIVDKVSYGNYLERRLTSRMVFTVDMFGLRGANKVFHFFDRDSDTIFNVRNLIREAIHEKKH